MGTMNSKIAKSVLVFFILIIAVQSTIAAVKTFRVQETDLVTLTPKAVDQDNDTVTYTYSPPLDSNGQWQTDYDDAGEYPITITASDGVNKKTQEVLLIVENKNQPPYLKEKKVTVKELQTLDLKPFVADPDNDPLEYVFTFPFDKQGLWTPGYEDQGTFVAKFSVRDGEFNFPMRVEVEVLDTNQPPQILRSFSEKEEVSVKENEQFSFYVEAVDGDVDELTYSWNLNGKPLSEDSEGEYFFDYDSAGRYRLALHISDVIHKIEKKWAVQVVDVNRKPTVNLLPLTMQEGEVATLQLPQEDEDGDKLRYVFDEKFNASGIWQTTYDDAGTYTLNYRVSDGKEEVKGKVEVTVLNVDRAPELRLPEKVEVKEGEKLSFVVDAVDPDGDKVKVSFVNAPEGARFDPETNTFCWSPGFDYIHRREGMLSNILNALRLEQRLLREKREVLEVKACSQELCSSGYLPLLVYNTNRAPALEIPSELTLTEGEVLQLRPGAYDPDGDMVRFYFTEPVHKRKGNWETAYEDAGEYTVNVTATDGSASQTLPVTVTVLQKNRQPTLTFRGDEYVLREGKEFVLPVTFFDPDNDSLSLQVENLPEGASFHNHTLVWTPPYHFVSSKSEDSLVNGVNLLGNIFGSPREHWISFVASDQEFNVSHPVKLVVQNVNQKPEIPRFVPEKPVTLRPGQPFNFSVTAFDVDGDNLTYVWTFEPGRDKVTGPTEVERTFVNPGEKEVSVVVSDGEYEVSQTWKVTVAEELLPAAEVVALEEPKFKVYVIEH